MDFDRKMGIAGSSIAWGAGALDRGLGLDDEEEEEEENKDEDDEDQENDDDDETDGVDLNHEENASGYADSSGCRGDVDGDSDGGADQDW